MQQIQLVTNRKGCRQSRYEAVASFTYADVAAEAGAAALEEAVAEYVCTW